MQVMDMCKSTGLGQQLQDKIIQVSWVLVNTHMEQRPIVHPSHVR